MASIDYQKLLEIQDNNSPSVIVLQPDDKAYYVDLNSRKIEDVNSIIVETDHNSRTVYFKVNRYFDNMDLTKTVCLIQYENVQKEKKVYTVPFFDVDTYSNGDENSDEPMILFPWTITENVTPQDGNIIFSIRFYKVDKNGTHFVYSLSTLPTKLTIKPDIGFHPEELLTEDEFAYLDNNYMAFLNNAAQAAQEGSLTWIVLN